MPGHWRLAPASATGRRSRDRPPRACRPNRAGRRTRRAARRRTGNCAACSRYGLPYRHAPPRWQRTALWRTRSGGHGRPRDTCCSARYRKWRPRRWRQGHGAPYEALRRKDRTPRERPKPGRCSSTAPVGPCRIRASAAVRAPPAAETRGPSGGPASTDQMPVLRCSLTSCRILCRELQMPCR